MENSSTKPEKIFLYFFIAGLVIGVIAEVFYYYFFLNYLKSSSPKTDFTFGSVFLTFVILSFLGAIFNYFLSKRVSGFPLRTIESNNQRHIKQVIYIIYPFCFIGLIVLFLLKRIKSLNFLIYLIAVIFSWLLFFKRLKNLEEKEGKDTRPILTLGEWFAILFLLLLFVVLFSLTLFFD